MELKQNSNYEYLRELEKDSLTLNEWTLILEILKENYSNLNSSTQIYDLCGGEGTFAQYLHQQFQLSSSTLIHVIDISEDLLTRRETSPQIQKHEEDVLSFVKRKDVKYNLALMKDSIHLLPHSEYFSLFEGIFHQLTPNGQFFIVTREPDVSWPLFSKARKGWKSMCLPSDELMQHLSHAGFPSVKRIKRPLPSKIDCEVWFSLIQARAFSFFMPPFCTAQDLEAGILLLKTLQTAQHWKKVKKEEAKELIEVKNNELQVNELNEDQHQELHGVFFNSEDNCFHFTQELVFIVAEKTSN